MTHNTIATVVLAGLLGASTVAHADRGHHHGRGHHRGHWHGGLVLDVGPLWWPGYAPYYYGPSAVIVTPPAPTVYVERPSSESTDYWYYCESPRGYYPYVKSCRDGWIKVPESPND